MATDQPTGSGGDRLSAGRVGKAHGLDGSFYVTRPRPGVLKNGLPLVLAGREVTVRRCSGTDDKPILAVEGAFKRTDVEALRGEDLWVSREHVPALGPDEWWAEDLEGCTVVDGDETVGTVHTLLVLPSCEVLEVTRAAGGADLLVPLVRDAVRSVDVVARRIEIDLVFLGEKEQS
jgi:16S rRNA processing protein RimM